jgi:hypothetical protein
MIDESTQPGDDTVNISVSEHLITEAKRLLEVQGQLETAVSIPSDGNEVAAILSKNPKDMIVLHSFEHDGVVYYLGIARED